MKLARLLKAVTKSVTAVFTEVVSLATFTSTALVVVLARVRVRPSTTLLSVLLAELSAMPLTCSSALAALVLRCIGLPVSVAS